MDRQEAIKVVRDNWPEGRILLKSALEILIPELKESKEEKIRKSIIEFLKTMASLKDGKTVSNEDFDSKALLEWADWLEKQGLLNNDKYQTVPVEILDRLYKSEKELEELKQGEQKSTDKVEPEFKIEKGKWYVCDTPRYADFVVGKAYFCPKNEMLKPYENGMALYVAKHCFHLWTIQDAKDGDIISTEHGEVFIYSHRKQLYSIAVAHCFLDNFGYFYFDGEFRYTESIHPATKEQRELLFTKMKESGYKWDAEKKELKKIEQNPVEPVTVVERDGEQWVRVCALGEDFIIAAHDYREGDKTTFTWEEACKIGTFSKKQGYIILVLLDKINARLKEIGGEPLDSASWTSSEYIQGYAWFVHFGRGVVNYTSKCGSFVARRVIAF